MSDKNVNILVGFEFNQTTQFKESMYASHFSSIRDLTYYLNYLSLPVTARFNVGKKVLSFFETGLFVDLNVGSRRTGTQYTSRPDGNNQYIYTETEINEKARVSSFNFGASIGIGVKVPISKFHLIIKPDYKFGLLALDDYGGHIVNRYFRIMIGVKI